MQTNCNAKLKVDELSLGCNDLASQQDQARDSLSTPVLLLLLLLFLLLLASLVWLSCYGISNKKKIFAASTFAAATYSIWSMEAGYIVSIERLSRRPKSIDHTQMQTHYLLLCKIVSILVLL